jgi:1-deoxy-D-xylulose-5-phosphate synthase
VTIINATFIKPLDEELLKKLSNENYNIISVEDNIKKGGFGYSVMEVLVREGYKGKFKNLGYNDEFIKQGRVDILYKENGLDPEGIAKEVLELI